MGDSAAFSNYVDHSVQLIGYRENRQDASASSDGGTAHGERFFQVERMGADSGACK